ncbi:MAG: ComEC/Rec2 family competence protein [Candidatus Kerfeldbacteria bacterium]|nr:ComEC/Rec2 family competence protein [Candidatus Kerfeldbacteria bacterium]
MLARKTRIQVGVLSLAAGAAVAGLAVPIVSIIVATMFVVAAAGWRPGWFMPLLFGLGLLRGWLLGAPGGISDEQPIIAALAAARAWLEGGINQALPPTEAALLNGLLLGGREDLPRDLLQAFRTTGTSHIVAVSGFNVTIVVSAVAALIRSLPLSRSPQLMVSVLAVTAFVILTGASPSVVRAGIMGSLVVLARYSGRLADGWHLLMLSAASMVLVQPAIVLSLSFQLSVAATAGLVLLAEPFEQRLRLVPAALGLRGSLASTLAAIMFTQPLILLYFGQVSLVAPLVNIIVLPLIPLAMLAGFVVGGLTALAPWLAAWAGWLAWLPLRVIVSVVTFGAALPNAAAQLGLVVSAAVSAINALAVGLFVMMTRKRHVAA